MVDLKHKNKLEVEDKKQKRKTRYQIKQEEIRKNKEQDFKQAMCLMGVLLGIILFCVLMGIITG